MHLYLTYTISLLHLERREQYPMLLQMLPHYHHYQKDLFEPTDLKNHLDSIKMFLVHLGQTINLQQKD
jgi:hypothetical protein